MYTTSAHTHTSVHTHTHTHSRMCAHMHVHARMHTHANTHTQTHTHTHTNTHTQTHTHICKTLASWWCTATVNHDLTVCAETSTKRMRKRGSASCVVLSCTSPTLWPGLPKSGTLSSSGKNMILIFLRTSSCLVQGRSVEEYFFLPFPPPPPQLPHPVFKFNKTLTGIDRLRISIL